MRKKLTTRTIETLKPRSKRYEVRDVLLPSFGVRVSPQGRKSFCVMLSNGGHQTRVTIGKYPIIGLSDARKKACELIANPQIIQRDTKADITVSETIELFIERYAKEHNKDWKGVSSRLKNDFGRMFGKRNINGINRTNIHSVLGEVIQRTIGAQPNRVLSAIRKLLNWCIEQGFIETNPAEGISKPRKELSRDRFLNTDELSLVLNSFDKFDYPFKPFGLLLIATGQRRGEVAGMKWSEVDLNDQVWCISGNRTKNGHQHFVPLSNLSMNILRDIPKINNSDFVFTTTGYSGISGFGKFKSKIDNICGFDDWRLHDLRRTVSTHLAPHVPQDVMRRILNHRSGGGSPMDSVYNRYDYANEKKEALELWGKKLNSFINSSLEFNFDWAMGRN